VLAVVWPGITALALLWTIAAWAVVTGVFEVVAAIRLRRKMRREWLLALSGVLSVVFGVLLVVWPAAGALTFGHADRRRGAGDGFHVSGAQLPDASPACR
jgi:uncharacterized membrane protein HdeD (DUF308 family)